MLLVKGGACVVLHPTLQMRSVSFLQKGCGRYSPTSRSNENDDIILYKDIISHVFSYRLNLILLLPQDLKPSISYLSPKELELVHKALKVSSLHAILAFSFLQSNPFEVVFISKWSLPVGAAGFWGSWWPKKTQWRALHNSSCWSCSYTRRTCESYKVNKKALFRMISLLQSEVKIYLNCSFRNWIGSLLLLDYCMTQLRIQMLLLLKG